MYVGSHIIVSGLYYQSFLVFNQCVCAWVVVVFLCSIMAHIQSHSFLYFKYFVLFPPSPLKVTTCSWLRCTSWATPSVWNTPTTPLLSWLLFTSTWTQRTSNYLTTTYRASRKSMVKNTSYSVLSV